ncbi:PIN domain-containing protein [Acidianus brierleyi]|uniref:PIN domain-containing protein n=1 Tax=Acidianus brierleyi TaxID=41673 RepID=A0A2U9II47_9CREN|nr:PIN domain-containing protein [Acidianus brierleyi]
MEEKKIIVDTNIIISKKFLDLNNVIVTESVVQELAEFIFQKYLDYMNSSQQERANGYIKLFKYLIEYLSKYPLLSHSFKDYIQAIDLSTSRNIDVTDALLVITALKLNTVIMTKDKDFERVKDLVKIKYL